MHRNALEIDMSNTSTPWQIKELADFGTGRPAGFDVFRVHNPYTDQAKVEYLKPVSRFRTEAEARAAIKAAA